MKSSWARAISGIVGLPSFIYDQIGSYVATPLMKAVGYSNDEIKQSLSSFEPSVSPLVPISSESTQQAANVYASSIESTMKKYDDGIIKSIQNGNYSDAGSQIWKGAVESIPYLAMTVATSGGGTVAVLSTIGTTAAAQRYGELIDPESEEGKKLSKGGKYLNSWMYGGFEAAGELVTAAGANAIKMAVKNIGKEAALS